MVRVIVMKLAEHNTDPSHFHISVVALNQIQVTVIMLPRIN